MIRNFLHQKRQRIVTLRSRLNANLLYLIDIYTAHTHFSINHEFDDTNFASNVILTTPQRQQCFCFFNIKEGKQITYTAGRFLSKTIKPAKFYKRSIRNVGGIVMSLKQQYLTLLQNIFLLKITNLTYKQWMFWERFEDTLHPVVKFFLHKKSYLPRWQGKRRIKRVVLRMLMKQ